ncbi:hypothetical protein PUN28_008163 [Cardiocondyla obscurior]|uniref:Chitin-binding type-2 domain-containing protein n=1 Tax=Cardiocondyla obscurior TaxID=286306 RepID=A0AAW2G2N9_9HYME
MKILLLPLGILLLIAIIYYSPNNREESLLQHANNIEKVPVELQIVRRRRTIHYCKSNQYYDQEEGRCLGVPGGGKVLHVENRRSCGINVLKPHCKSSLYYHICKRDKSILAQCASNQIFDDRLQRCAYYDSSKFTPNIIPPEDYMYYDHFRVPKCTKSGRFPVLGQCSMFYTCDTNGHRFYQSVFKCPQNTGYHADRGICNVGSDCLNDNSVGAVCIPNAPGENVGSPSFDKAAGESVTETSEILEEVKPSEVDTIVEREENLTTSASIIDTLLENNYDNNDNNTSVPSDSSSLLKSVKDVPDLDIGEETMRTQEMTLPETVGKILDESQNVEDQSPLLRIETTSSTSATLINPEYRTNDDIDSETREIEPLSSDSYVLSKLSNKTQDVVTEQYNNIKDSIITSNFNTEETDLESTTNNALELFPITDVSPNIDEKMQDAAIKQYKNNEDRIFTSSNFSTVTDLVDPLTSGVSDVPESVPIGDILPNVNEKIQEATTKQYKNNGDNVSNFNTDLVSPYSESSPINDKLDEEISNVNTEIYGKNDEAVILPESNTEVVNLNLTPELKDVSTITDNLKNNDSDISFSESTPAILPQQTASDQFTTDRLSETTLSLGDKLVDDSISTPDGVKSMR